MANPSKHTPKNLPKIFPKQNSLLEGGKNDLISEKEFVAKILAANEAKNNKDFQKADEIRNILHSQGIMLEDRVGGTKWRRF